jgi:hypothetical protein
MEGKLVLVVARIPGLLIVSIRLSPNKRDEKPIWLGLFTI